MLKLNILSQEVINQIAAGEVIERPSSIVKELVDNSIDANSTEITVKIVDGGIKSIEVTDNGIGIAKENLSEIFLPHTTSKLKEISDLSTISTMGFRGEALSTILSVSHVVIKSKAEDSKVGYELNFDKKDGLPKISPKEKGTTIVVKDLFYNTPARLKFLKSPDTEYRKIYDILVKYAICYPAIKFLFFKDGKEVFNLFNISKELVSRERIAEVLKKDFVKNMITISSNGAGLKIDGLIGHPSNISVKNSNQYIYVNNRPLWDNGIAKSIHQGYSRFIPSGMKVPFVIKISINPDLIDVNVHPRKEEIRFLNPYRVYIAIENAVIQALKSVTKSDIGDITPSHPLHQQDFKVLDNSLFDRTEIKYSPTSQIKEMRFDKQPSEFNIKNSLDFSKELLSSELGIEEQSGREFKNIFQIFNKYIVIEFSDEVWLIDQHAAAERINFEKLLKEQNTENKDIQALLLPLELEISESERLLILENIELFTKLGFSIEELDNTLLIKAIPAYIDVNKIQEIFDSLDEETDVTDNITKLQEDIIATIACHGSVRAGQSLTSSECVSIFNELKLCENPYSCPHGRPAVWKLKLSEIDSNFLRTY